jgi:hypothetical protein
VVGKQYKVIITEPAFRRYSKTILPYLKKFFSRKRAAEIQQTILEIAKTLEQMPSRGSKETYLQHLKKEYRYVLHKESRYFVLKLIYFIDEDKATVYITDFFPTSMNPDDIVS